MKFYIAFSIAGSNKFITANIETSLPTGCVYSVGDVVSIANETFTVVHSRRPDYKPEDGTKLGWSALNTVKGEPLRSPPAVLNRFRILENMGWTINKEAFVKKHFAKK